MLSFGDPEKIKDLGLAIKQVLQMEKLLREQKKLLKAEKLRRLGARFKKGDRVRFQYLADVARMATVLNVRIEEARWEYYLEYAGLRTGDVLHSWVEEDRIFEYHPEFATGKKKASSGKKKTREKKEVPVKKEVQDELKSLGLF